MRVSPAMWFGARVKTSRTRSSNEAGAADPPGDLRCAARVRTAASWRSAIPAKAIVGSGTTMTPILPLSAALASISIKVCPWAA
ncbi:MAG: hypothetical protein IPL47_03220 [Phyllobacteriaceae bacterium]|nr:hypothetical protein [Phyllobacteriaceae bacterium]